jgi:hypothetical protein
MAVSRSGGVKWSEIRLWLDERTTGEVELDDYRGRTVYDVSRQQAVIMPTGTISASDFINKMKVPAVSANAPIISFLREPSNDSHFPNNSATISCIFRLTFQAQSGLPYPHTNSGPSAVLQRRSLTDGGSWSTVGNVSPRQITGSSTDFTLAATVTGDYQYRFVVTASVKGPVTITDLNSELVVKALTTQPTRAVNVVESANPPAPSVTVRSSGPRVTRDYDTLIHENGWQSDSIAKHSFNRIATFEIPGYNTAADTFYTYQSHQWYATPAFTKNGSSVGKAITSGSGGAGASYSFARSFPSSDVSIGPSDTLDSVTWELTVEFSLFVKYKGPDGLVVTVQGAIFSATETVNVDYQWIEEPPEPEPETVYAKLTSFTIPSSVVEGNDFTISLRFQNAVGKTYTISTDRDDRVLIGRTGTPPPGSFSVSAQVPSNGVASHTCRTIAYNKYEGGIGASITISLVDMSGDNPLNPWLGSGQSKSLTIRDASATHSSSLNTTSLNEGGTFEFTVTGTNTSDTTLGWDTTFPSDAVSSTSGSVQQDFFGSDKTGSYRGTVVLGTLVRPTHYENVQGRIRTYKQGTLHSQTGTLTIRNTHTKPDPDPVASGGSISATGKYIENIVNGQTRDFVAGAQITINANGTYSIKTFGNQGAGSSSGSLTSPQPLTNNWITRIVPGSASAGDLITSQEDAGSGTGSNPTGQLFEVFRSGTDYISATISGDRVRNQIATYSGSASWEIYNTVTKQRIPGGAVTISASARVITNKTSSTPDTTPGFSLTHPQYFFYREKIDAGDYRYTVVWNSKVVVDREFLNYSFPPDSVKGSDGKTYSIGSPASYQWYYSVSQGTGAADPGTQAPPPQVAPDPEIIETYCYGNDLYGTKRFYNADGTKLRDDRDVLIRRNAPSCITVDSEGVPTTIPGDTGGPPGVEPAVYVVGSVVPGSVFCDGTTKKWKVYTSKSGTTANREQVNSTDCGYKEPPPPPTYVVGSIVPGSEKCVGTTKVWQVYTTTAGATAPRAQLNSSDCGYTPPAAPTFTVGAEVPNSSFCYGTTRVYQVYKTTAGATEYTSELNSAACGYKPPPVAVPSPTYTVGSIVPGSEKCVGTTKVWEVYTTTTGATAPRAQTNSPDCGYKPPAAPTYTVGSIVPGSEYCSGTTRIYKVYTTTAGATTTKRETNSPSCGYKPPAVAAPPPKSTTVQDSSAKPKLTGFDVLRPGQSGRA